MVKYNKINAKLSSLQISELKTAVKNNEGTTLRINSKMFNSDNLPHELFLTQRQITKLRNAIENNMSTDIKLSKAQIKKIIISGGALGSILGRLLPNLIKLASPILKNVVASLGLSAAMSGIDGAIQKKIHGYGTTVIFSNEEINDLMKIIQAFEDKDILLKGVTKTVKNDINNQKGGAFGMLLGALGVSLLGDLLSGRGVFRSVHGLHRTGEEIKKKHINFTKTTSFNKF